MQILRVFLCAVLAAAGGWVAGNQFGFPLAGLFIGFLLWAGWHCVQAGRLWRWVNKGQTGTPPALFGFWKILTTRLQRSRQLQYAATKNIREVFHRISQLTRAIDEGIILLDREHHLQWWNNSAGRMLELESGFRGEALTGLIRNPAFISFLEQDEFNHVLELQDHGSMGNWKSYAAYRFGEGEIVLIITDITRLKKAELMRKDFVGNVSHELRTPLTVLRGYLETLVDSGMVDDPRVIKAFTQMRVQVQRMQDMADDLVTLSKLESKVAMPVVAKEKINLRSLFDRLMDEARMVSEGQHKLEMSCDPDLAIMADLQEIHSAVGNLVINAVRHNVPGTKISLEAIKTEGFVDIKVSDDGKGISADAIPRLTERFYRADSSRHSGEGGTGLGLAIVKHIMNRYGGQLLIKSKLGEGSQFTCRFPL